MSFLEGIVKRANKYVLLVAGIVVISLTCCTPKDDEVALRELVEKAAKLAEEHDIGGLMDLTTEDFKATPGNFDRIGAKRMLFVTFRHYGELDIIHPRPNVDLESKDKSPSVSFPFLIVRKGQSMPELKELYDNPRGWIEKVGESADLYRLRLNVVKHGGNWLVKKAYLEGFSSSGFRK
jgi:hypothetical protein